MSLSPGQILNNRYRIVKLLGQGGFGSVYKAWDLNLERPRALKENLSTSPEAQRQFKLEAQILCDLTHPNLPKVIDHFVLPGQGQYLVMEFVEGEDLEAMLARLGAPLPEAQALRWVEQVCDALAYLHSQSPAVIHRDVKPANIKITPAGKAMLVDFGIAKVFDPQVRTTAGARAVTPGYSPQEQYGQGATDARTDIYALGATLYHLLTGQQPPESIQRNLGAQLLPLRALNPAISPQVESAVLMSMAMRPEQRFQSAAQFKAALQSRLAPVNVQGSVVPGMAAPMIQSAAPIRRASRPAAPAPASLKPLLLGAAGLVVLAVVLLGLVAALFWKASSRASATPSAALTYVALARATGATAAGLPTATSAPPTVTHTAPPTATPTSPPPTATFTHTPTPPPTSTASPDTLGTWNFTSQGDNWNSKFTVQFNSNHTISYTKGSETAAGKWSLSGNKISFDVNNYSFWDGTVSGDEMSGTAHNNGGLTCTWTAVRVQP